MKVDAPDGRRAKQMAVKLMRALIKAGTEGIDVDYEFDWIDGKETFPQPGATVHICARGGPVIGVFTGEVNQWPMFMTGQAIEPVECRFWSDELTGKHSAQVTEAEP